MILPNADTFDAKAQNKIEKLFTNKHIKKKESGHLNNFNRSKIMADYKITNLQNFSQRLLPPINFLKFQ